MTIRQTRSNSCIDTFLTKISSRFGATGCSLYFLEDFQSRQCLYAGPLDDRSINRMSGRVQKYDNIFGKNTIFNKHLVVNNREVILKARAVELKASVRELEDDGVKGDEFEDEGVEP